MPGDINEDGIIGRGENTDTHEDDDYALLNEYIKIKYPENLEEDKKEEDKKEESEEDKETVKIDVDKVDELLCDLNADGRIDSKDLQLLDDYMKLKLCDINKDK